MGLQYGHAQHRRHRRRPPIVYDSLRVGSHVACAGGGDRGRPVGGSQDESCAPVAGARDGGQGLRGREAYHPLEKNLMKVGMGTSGSLEIAVRSHEGHRV